MDLQLASVAKSENDINRILEYGHMAIFEDDDGLLTLKSPFISGEQKINQASSLDGLESFDVVCLNDIGIDHVAYAHGSDDNAIVLTSRCNSNCIMCPYSENYRRTAKNVDLDYIKGLIDYLPSDIPHLIITGGEPTLLRESFLDVMNQLKRKFEKTEFLLLTNGRTMADGLYAKKALDAVPERMLWGIPVHGPNCQIHDLISQTPGSFIQTERGIKHLLEDNRKVEIRIVVSRLNCESLEATAEYISHVLPTVDHVTFMAMEMCGAAAINYKKIWIDYEQAARSSEKAASILIRNGIKTVFYNFPLCKVHRGFWALCADSITDHKIKYLKDCDSCSVRSICGGVFATTLGLSEMSLSPIKEVL